MAVLDPNPIPRKKKAPERRVFDLDPDQPAAALTLRPAGFAAAAAAEDERAFLVEQYMTGSDIRGPAPMPWLDIPPSDTLFRVATLICHMQAPTDPNERMDSMALIRLSEDAPLNWGAIMAWFSELALGMTESLGNLPSGPTGS